MGVGKAALARLLSDRWGGKACFESIEDPFVGQDSRAFDRELFYLLTRFRQQRDVCEANGLKISNYLFGKSWIFAQMNLPEADLPIFQRVYDSLVDEVPAPDLVLLLQADLETLLRRNYLKNPKFDKSLSPDHLEALIQRYYHFFSFYTKAPVLKIPCASLDFVTDSNDLERIVCLIEDRLNGKRKPPLQQLKIETKHATI